MYVSDDVKPVFDHEKVVIVGAGLAGTLMAILLAQRGAKVELIERQNYRDGVPFSNGRSFNITISSRGVCAMQAAGIWERVKDRTIPITGRMCHMGLDQTEFPYSSDRSAKLYGARRSDVNDELLACARELDNISFRFETTITELDKRRGALCVAPVGGGESEWIEDADFVIGADGVFSSVRQIIHKSERVEYHQRFLDWGYREVFIPAREVDGKPKFAMSPHSLHVWPRGDLMMFALPNPDGSFTGNFIYPMDREPDFQVPGKISAIFKREFPDVAAVVPDIEEHFSAIPVSYFPTQRHSKWYHGDRVVLLGDAAHATVPFYGQGMNSSFESAMELLDCLERHGADREAAFAEYQHSRKPHTDAVADLSIENFMELRSNFQSLVPQARRRVEVILHKLFPNQYQPLHVLVSHTQTKYRDAIDRCERRDRLLRWCGIDLLVYAMAGAQWLLNHSRQVPRQSLPGGTIKAGSPSQLST